MDNQQYADNRSFILERQKQGHTFNQIKHALIHERNVDPKEAAIIMHRLGVQEARSRSGGGGIDINGRMALGAVFFIGGALVWFFTYQAASNGGGTYTVPYGAMIFGAIQFFRGLADA